MLKINLFVGMIFAASAAFPQIINQGSNSQHRNHNIKEVSDNYDYWKVIAW